MDLCSVSQFRDSLNSPNILLRTLHNVIYEPDTLCCNKHFAEARATIEQRCVMLYAPITHQATAMARRAIEALKHTNTEICDLRIREKEILYSGLISGKCCMLIESIPPGIPLNEAIHTLSRSHLLLGLSKLQARLKRLNISHNYLNLYNIIVDSNYTWHTIRNYYVETEYGGDKQAFSELERCINECALPDEESTMDHDRLLLHSTHTDQYGTLHYPIRESRRRFKSSHGVGFKDRFGYIVIKDEYSWASDFEENRAIVRLNNGTMGVINRKGAYIIEPRYSHIEYDSYSGIFTTYIGDVCKKYNYLGEEIE